MNNLPSELILRIFSHLFAVDLINLTTISQRFNELIANTELSHKLTLNFRKLNDGDGEIRREYKNLRIGSFKPQIHVKILQNFGANFTKLEFSFCKLKLDVFRRVLVQCPNVKILNFTQAQLSDVPNRLTEPLPALIDVDLKVVFSDPRVFKVLMNCVCRSVCMDLKYRHASGNVVDFLRFLAVQDHLLELKLTDFFRTNLFIDNCLDRVNFKLTKLCVKNINLARTDYFKRFIENNHVDSLQSLEIFKLDRCNLSQIIGSCKFLTELKIDGTSALSEIEEMSNLERLIVYAQLPLNLNQLIHKFPALKEIEMHYCRLCYDEQELMKAYGRISFPSGLNKLHIIDTIVAKLKTKSIKSLVLKNAKICEDFHESNDMIEELYVESCDLNDEDFEKIFTHMRNLKSLTIVDEKITQKTIDKMKMCENLKLLRLKKLRKIVDVKLLQENKSLKIYLA